MLDWLNRTALLFNTFYLFIRVPLVLTLLGLFLLGHLAGLTFSVCLALFLVAVILELVAVVHKCTVLSFKEDESDLLFIPLVKSVMVVLLLAELFFAPSMGVLIATLYVFSFSTALFNLLFIYSAYKDAQMRGDTAHFNYAYLLLPIIRSISLFFLATTLFFPSSSMLSLFIYVALTLVALSLAIEAFAPASLEADFNTEHTKLFQKFCIPSTMLVSSKLGLRWDGITGNHTQMDESNDYKINRSPSSN